MKCNNYCSRCGNNYIFRHIFFNLHFLFYCACSFSVYFQSRDYDVDVTKSTISAIKSNIQLSLSPVCTRPKDVVKIGQKSITVVLGALETVPNGLDKWTAVLIAMVELLKKLGTYGNEYNYLERQKSHETAETNMRYIQSTK